MKIDMIYVKDVFRIFFRNKWKEISEDFWNRPDYIVVPVAMLMFASMIVAAFYIVVGFGCIILYIVGLFGLIIETSGVWSYFGWGLSTSVGLTALFFISWGLVLFSKWIVANYRKAVIEATKLKVKRIQGE